MILKSYTEEKYEKDYLCSFNSRNNSCFCSL